MDIHAATVARPTLHLSGPKLRAALGTLIAAAENVGGIERFAQAVALKAAVMEDRLGHGRAGQLERAAFDEILPLMPTVRRRVGSLIAQQGWPQVRAAIVTLLHDAHVPGTADARVAAFEGTLRTPPSPHALRLHLPPRFIRDLAAEILHAAHPEHYPLMTRWVWDAHANTGVLREIWHDTASGSDDVDRIVIGVPDTHETFLVLREELSQFLADTGIFRDMLWYVDLLCAQIYADYINAQGGAYLKTDFNAGATDPLEHTRRILGLDGRGADLRPWSHPAGDTASLGGGDLLPSTR